MRNWTYQSQGHKPDSQKAYLHSLRIRNVCVQYENNPATGFQDIARKLNTDA